MNNQSIDDILKSIPDETRNVVKSLLDRYKSALEYLGNSQEDVCFRKSIFIEDQYECHSKSGVTVSQNALDTVENHMLGKYSKLMSEEDMDKACNELMENDPEFKKQMNNLKKKLS